MEALNDIHEHILVMPKATAHDLEVHACGR